MGSIIAGNDRIGGCAQHCAYTTLAILQLHDRKKQKKIIHSHYAKHHRSTNQVSQGLPEDQP